jgi:arylsulfatase A-like enzyme
MPPPPPVSRERNGEVRPRQDNAEYASMISVLDDGFGRILRKLDDTGDAANTVVLFLSDNGGLAVLTKPGPTSNTPLRAGKGWLYEGGIRIPLVVRVPGLAKPGTTISSPVITTDLFPTVLDLAGLPLQPEKHLDGITLKPLLSGGRARPRTMYWHYPHYHGSTWAPGGAIRRNNWKLIEFFEENTKELYNIAEDPGERTDLAASMPDVVKQLAGDLAAWRKRVGAKMPVPGSPA